MILRSILVAVPFVLAAVAAPAGAQKTKAPADSAIHLQFNWKPGTTARVEAERVRVRRVEGGGDSTRTASTYTMRVEAHPRGRLVRYEDFAVPGVAGGAAAVEALLGAFSPAYVVSNGGEFLHVDDVARMKEQITTLLDRSLEGARDSMPAALRQMLDNVTSAEALNGVAAQEWNALVGFWIGAELEPGIEYEVSAEEPSPMFPGAVFEMTYTFALTRRVPCHPGDQDERCVELGLASSPDQEQVRTFMKRFMGQMGAPADEVERLVSEMKVESYVSVVMEPGTMLPHALEVLREVTLVDRGPGGGLAPVTATDRRSYRYTYGS